MPAPNAITPEKLSRLVGTAGCPRIIDLREDATRTIPGAITGAMPGAIPSGRPPARRGDPVIVVDRDGGTAATAAAAVLRSDGADAEILDGGYDAWERAGLLTVVLTHLPPRRADGRTWWVTRARPKVDRIACPWLIRRFVDPDARILFVPPAEVLAVAERERAEPFDVVDDGVFWSHRGPLCTFDIMVDAFALADHTPLARLAAIVRGADTDRLDLAPEAAGLLAISLGLSRSHGDDHAQLDAGMPIYDALYRWARGARDERHTWSSHQPSRARVTA